MAFQGVDFFDVESFLTEEERAVRDTVRRWVDEAVMPIIADRYLEGRFPLELVPQMAELGMLGPTLPAEYGCAELSDIAYGLIMQELERGDSGLRSFASVQSSLVMYPIFAFGSEEQRRQWLPRLASGAAIGCFGLTEPDSGSDPGAMRTRARRDGADWVLDGTKMWITNGSVADVAVVWARTDGGVHGFLVPTDTPGFAARDIPRKLSLRASVTSELVLDGVRLPDSARLPEVHSLRGPLSCLDEARFGILFGAAGAARACYEAALDYAVQREQFGVPIASFQLTQRKLVEMVVRVQKATLLALHLARLKDKGLLAPAQVSFGKMDNVREALWVAREARSVLGANGITLEYPVIRHMNNLESVVTYEGTNEVHTLVLGQTITGIDAFAPR